MLLAFALTQAISPDMAPVDIYKQAMRVMRSIAAPAYLQFDSRGENKHHGKVVVGLAEFSERTSGRAFLVRSLRDKTGKAQWVRPERIIAPDLFLGHNVTATPPPNARGFSLGMDTEADANLKVIGVVSAVHYDVSYVGAEDLQDCSKAIHLKLQPRTDPLIYNLRDLWVDPRTSQICKAIAIWHAPVGFTLQNVAVTLDVGESGYITSWSVAATAHYIFGQDSFEQQASYTNFRSVDEPVWTALQPQ